MGGGRAGGGNADTNWAAAREVLEKKKETDQVLFKRDEFKWDDCQGDGAMETTSY